MVVKILKEDFEEKVTPFNIYDIAVKTLPEEDIKVIGPDLHLRNTYESRVLVNRMSANCRNPWAVSVERDLEDSDEWYVLPYCADDSDWMIDHVYMRRGN